jgi:hypothetical protein
MGQRLAVDNDCSITRRTFHLPIHAVLLGALGVLFSTGACLAQSSPSALEQFEARIKRDAHTLGTDPRLKKLSPQQRKNLVEFVAGNTLFVTLHELSHAAVTELDLPVVGREEDAADAFAVVWLLKEGSAISHRALVDAAEGWFLSDRRDRRNGESIVFYDEHGLDKQRAYQIVCLMVGSDPMKFADLAKETRLPEYRQRTCKRDYTRASTSWAALLKPYRRSAGQPKTKIDVTYGEAKGRLGVYADGFRTLQLLNVVASEAEDQLEWPAPFAIEAESCGAINAQWVATTRKLTVCYELAADFADLYRDFHNARTARKKRKSK